MNQRMRIQVEHHADLRAAPRSLYRGERRIDIIEIMDQWYGPGYCYESADQATDFSNKAKRVVDAVDKLRKQKLYSTEFITGRFKLGLARTLNVPTQQRPLVCFITRRRSSCKNGFRISGKHSLARSRQSGLSSHNLVNMASPLGSKADIAQSHRKLHSRRQPRPSRARGCGLNANSYVPDIAERN
jgi:hypothetical protein